MSTKLAYQIKSEWIIDLVITTYKVIILHCDQCSKLAFPQAPLTPNFVTGKIRPGVEPGDKAKI